MRLKSRPLLKREQVRKSRSNGTATPPSIRLKNQDAFEFLARLKPASVDLFVSSPPYCMGKAYETSIDSTDFMNMHDRLAPLLVRALKDGGSLCWQVGHHVHNGVVTPLDALVYAIFSKQKELHLRNRIVWTFAHGVHASRRFSGRHETILWFTKGSDYTFNLDAVRVPQKYPGKRHYKGPKKGTAKGNPLGKNPSDVWEIPNVKANHIEKTNHPCQFPVALVRRLIRALTPIGGTVVVPFLVQELRHSLPCWRQNTSQAAISSRPTLTSPRHVSDSCGVDVSCIGRWTVLFTNPRKPRQSRRGRPIF